MIVARNRLAGAGAGVQIMGPMGLPVAKELHGATPVQIMGGAGGDVEVMQGGFGASFGTNFSKQ